jgi:hypothetical protein
VAIGLWIRSLATPASTIQPSNSSVIPAGYWIARKPPEAFSRPPRDHHSPTMRANRFLPLLWLVSTLGCGTTKHEGNNDGGSHDGCTPTCDGRQCGDDGCGGTCGTCEAPQTCGGTGQTGVCGTPSHSCGMQLNENPVAFCETFDQPSPVTNRSGELNGALWGVMRIGGLVSYGRPFTWANPQIDLCGTEVPGEAESDLRICSGQLRDGVNDNLSGDFEAGGPVALTMYAKQPFDFAGRTGTVAFDVTNDSEGTE